MRTCEFEGCNRRHKAKGLCVNHYQQSLDGRALVPLRSTTQRVCAFEDCGREYYAKGLCVSHYVLRQRDLPPTAAQRLCTVEGCGRKHLAGGLCRRHYNRVHRARDPRGCLREGCDTCEDVAWLRAAGETEENIAHRIGLSVSTVQTHTRAVRG
jgi:hypothetical protein